MEPGLSYSIEEFARLNGVSKSQMYAEIAAGTGPVTFTIGNRRRISVESGVRHACRQRLAP